MVKHLKRKKSSKSSKRSGNNKQISCARHWCFTFNNYLPEDIVKITNIPSSKIVRYVFQEETGEAGEKEDNEGTPHLQGYIDYGKDNKDRPLHYFKRLLDLKEGGRWIHWSKTRNVQASIKYCQKERTRTGETFYRGISKPYKATVYQWQPWMYKVKGIVEEEPDTRSIHWIHEKEGKRCKTEFMKWLYQNSERVLILSGRAVDMKQGVVSWINANEGQYPRTILINVPRSKTNDDKTFISYAGLEEIKDMFFYSSKYEGGMVCGPNPHIIITSNREPDYDQMSDDRWKVINI